MNARQRFTLAHEIAHTFFYKGTDRVLVPTFNVKTRQEYRALEEICDLAAKRILVPKRLLSNEIVASIGDSERIDVKFVQNMVSRFKVSYEVMLDRLRAAEPENVFARCILLAREERDGHPKVTGWYMGMSLLSVFPPIQRNELIVNWFPEFPQGILERNGTRECSVLRNGRELLFRKTALRKGGDFLLQIDDLGRLAPSSK